MTSICHAQDIPLELASLDTTKKARQTYAEPEVKRSDVRERIDLTFNLSEFSYLNTSYPGNDYWDDYVNQPSYRVKIEYAGIQRVIYDQLGKLANRYYKQELANYWDQSYLHPLDLDRRMRQYGIESSDSNDRWWLRSWRESLPPEKGGQITTIHRVGSRIDVIRIGPIGLNNEGRFSWETWRVDVEDNSDSKLSDIEAIQNQALEEKYNLGIRSPEAEYTSDWYQIRFGAKVNIRVDNLTEENRSQLGVSFKLNLLNIHGDAYLRFSGSAQIQPFTGKAEVRFQLSLLEF